MNRNCSHLISISISRASKNPLMLGDKYHAQMKHTYQYVDSAKDIFRQHASIDQHSFLTE